ncbi:MAG: YfiR family protein [Gammaproteobacteria bacterium]|nr:YfiR family protein [Gammaproteobacteria bacterium]NVK89323.1 YfiR family protein [Gammaproteobacteria bacterium]
MYKIIKWTILFATAFLAGAACAQETEERVRSSILSRLPGFVYWPKESDFNLTTTPYRLCIYRDRDYYTFIRGYLRDETVRGLPIEFQFTRDLSDLKACHVAYVGKVSVREIQLIVQRKLVEHTIFVASSEQSAAMGLHIRLFVGASKKFDIEVNQAAFERSGSELKVNFLKHAKKVYPGTTASGGQ